MLYKNQKEKAEKPDKPEMIQNPPMVFKMPPLTDKYGSIGVESRSEERSESFIVNRPKVKKDVFKTKRQLKEEEEKRAILRLKIRCMNFFSFLITKNQDNFTCVIK